MTQPPPAEPPLPPPDAQAPAPAAPNTSGLAIASLVLGIVGPCTAGLGSLVGLILGIVALVKISGSKGRKKGTPLAVVGIVLSVLCFMALPLAPVILLPAVHQAVVLAKQAAFVSNLSQVSRAAHAYSADNKGQLPPPDEWPDVLQPYLGDPRVLRDPSADKEDRAVAMNRLLAGVSLAQVRDAGRTVLFFECALGSPPAGGPELLPPKPRHPSGYVMSFVDGHVECIRPEDLETLIWDPGDQGSTP